MLFCYTVVLVLFTLDFALRVGSICLVQSGHCSPLPPMSVHPPRPEPHLYMQAGVVSRNERNRARRRRLRIYPEMYCPEEDLPFTRFPSGPPRRGPPWGTVFGQHWVTCRSNVGVFFLGALLMQRVGEAQRTAHMYHTCPELIRVTSLGHRCSCVQSLLQGCQFVQDAEGSLHRSEHCSSFNWGDQYPPDPDAHDYYDLQYTLTCVGLCDVCLFQRIEEAVSSGESVVA